MAVDPTPGESIDESPVIRVSASDLVRRSYDHEAMGKYDQAILDMLRALYIQQSPSKGTPLPKLIERSQDGS